MRNLKSHASLNRNIMTHLFKRPSLGEGPPICSQGCQDDTNRLKAICVQHVSTPFSKDKRQAEEKQWRVSERTLCATALLGGWPAGYWAMRRFRHKSVSWKRILGVP